MTRFFSLMAMTNRLVSERATPYSVPKNSSQLLGDTSRHIGARADGHLKLREYGQQIRSGGAGDAWTAVRQ